MALIMCNMALVQPGSLVIDPFVGTGSVLVPCTTFGGICFGTDIDSRVLHGKAGKTIKSNFDQYKLRVPDLIRADNSRSPLRCPHYFDAVVCDPPYGIRAGARKSGRRDCAPANSTAPPPPPASVSSDQKPIKPKYGPRPIPDEWLENHIPATQPYAAEDVMRDLLVFAAKNLRVGGRVVYLLPTTYDYTDADLPTHPQLRVVGNSEERLTSKYARRLITMVKTVETSDIPSNLDDGFKSDFSFAKLREKIVASNKKPKTASD
ncbi:hypothetical protein DYB28_014928 [Aphanomyces astaci]|uniref:Ribosomal RNA large subunit methyltransferase K/L-like methyltransferase domain-containing protein n=1 Tax=Aphanomyces astaci TaxID=112090 RepID=A0A9X8H9E4_APHAT|nr:hypothetical protein DYB28_014928 [Aphanomyces astaci]